MQQNIQFKKNNWNIFIQITQFPDGGQFVQTFLVKLQSLDNDNFVVKIDGSSNEEIAGWLHD